MRDNDLTKERDIKHTETYEGKTRTFTTFHGRERPRLAVICYRMHDISRRGLSRHSTAVVISLARSATTKSRFKSNTKVSRTAPSQEATSSYMVIRAR